jgi:hypothetical protein
MRSYPARCGGVNVERERGTAGPPFTFTLTFNSDPVG